MSHDHCMASILGVLGVAGRRRLFSARISGLGFHSYWHFFAFFFYIFAFLGIGSSFYRLCDETITDTSTVCSFSRANGTRDSVLYDRR